MDAHVLLNAKFLEYMCDVTNCKYEMNIGNEKF